MNTEFWMPSNKAELISAIEHEWDLLLHSVSALDPENTAMSDAEGWSPKDNLAHLTEWMKILMGFYMDKRRAHEVMGVPAEVTQVWDFEARNHLLFERNRERSMEDVMGELKKVYFELTARLGSMTFEDLMRPQHPFDPTKRPLLHFVVGGTIEHFAEHRQRIERRP